jgi:hypothetical protein
MGKCTVTQNTAKPAVDLSAAFILTQSDLLGKDAALQQARRSLAVQSGKIETNKIKRQDSYAGTPKGQIVEELMLEYLKVALVKPSLLGENVL